MYKTYQKPAVYALPDVKVPPPKLSKIVIFIVSFLSKFYVYMLFGFAKITLKNDDILFDVFKRALSKESRCIIAFRHPDGREPQFLVWFFLYKLASFAAKKKVRFAIRPHSIFVYGYEVVRWGGWTARFFMPNLGAIPIHHTKMDSKGMARIHNTIIDGPYPLSLAPEGQVSYSVDTLPRLEAGVVRIGFQAACQLKEKDENCPLEILPLSFHLRYDKYGKAAMEKLLVKIEKTCGLKINETKKLSFTERLKQCRNIILETNEKRYAIKTDASLSFEERLKKVIYTSLELAERTLAGNNDNPPESIKDDDDFFSRLYKVRHDCWDRIFVPGVENFKTISALERSVMDLQAGEAWYASRHQELSDFGWYFRCPIPKEDGPLHKKVEYVQNLWDLANRTMGGAISGRVNIPPKKIILETAQPVNLTEKLTLYKEDKKTAIAETLAQLEKLFLDCIDDVNKSE